MEARAQLKKLRISPKKVRLVVDLVRNMDLQQALDVLSHLPHRSAPYIVKLLLSAIANLEQKNAQKRIPRKTLFIKEIYANGGTMLKRIRPAPKGVAHRIRKRFSHVAVVIASKVGVHFDATISSEGQKKIVTEKKLPSTAPKPVISVDQGSGSLEAQGTKSVANTEKVSTGEADEVDGKK